MTKPRLAGDPRTAARTLCSALILLCPLTSARAQSSRGPAVQHETARDVAVDLRADQFARIRAALARDARARVIVHLEVPHYEQLAASSRSAKGPAPVALADAQLAAAIAAARQRELAALAATPHTVNRTYETIPFVALTVSEPALDVLQRSPGILGITADHLGRPLLDNTVNIIGAPAAWIGGYDGTGWYVAVLDTGIRASHDFFAGKTIIQACFASGQDGDSGNGGDCPNGLATDTTSANAAQHYSAVTFPNDYDHGTHVAGIATGDDQTLTTPLRGVAPGADIIAVQVFSQFFNEPLCDNGNPDDCLMYNESDVIAGLVHVYSLRATYNIAAVNMSIGGGTYWDQAACDADHSGIKAAVDNLRGADIAAVIASGNDSLCGEVSAPGCISSAIAVGATEDDDDEAFFSNFHPTMLDLYAPGVFINSSQGASDGDYGDYSGTSMATPHVAGAWAVLQHARPGADVASVLSALRTTGDPINGRCDPTPDQLRIRLDLAVNRLQSLAPECTDPPASDPRPLWTELVAPLGANAGYPDYQTVSTNLQVVNSLRLLASIFTRAAQKLTDLSSEDDDEAEGRCVCSLTEIHFDVKKKDCVSTNNPCNVTPVGDYPIWLPTDAFKTPGNAARFALKYLDFLDGLRNELNQIATALQNIGANLDNLGDLLTQFLTYVDRFTEGYHLGGYSTERPELHFCVGYGGHGAFASMLNLFDEVSIGGRYTSHNLSREHRAQFRSGGFGVTAFGRSISLLPGIEAGLQMDGFKLWDASEPFGIDLGIVGNPFCPDGPGFDLNTVDAYDVFDLVDQSDVAAFDTSSDSCLQPGEFLIIDFFEAQYQSVDGSFYTWPRPAVIADWETQNTAVFAAGLNLPLKTSLEKRIPPTGIILFPGAVLFPKFTLDAGVEWTHKAYGLRQRLQDMVNLSLPATAQLGPDDFERPMHFLQAPDVSADDGTSAYVRPRIAADLLIGIPLARFLQVGITASVGLSVRVEPAAYGGVHDLNVALTDTLLNSNPPPDLPCDPIVESTPTTECTNTLFVNADGDPLSSGTYTCDTDQIVIYHCAAAENELSCTIENAARDCPETQECVTEYGCTAHGVCTRILNPGPDGLEGTDDDVLDVVHDTTWAACSGESVCDKTAINAGAPCDDASDCPAPLACVGGKLSGEPCMTDENCPDGHCENPSAPCVPLPPPGYFAPYQCIDHDNPAITGWQGPGCHPLSVGFTSACACATDADCVAGLETCFDGTCAVGGDPIDCVCDPTDPSPCPTGRLCHDGACVLDCSANGDADCAFDQICNGVRCQSPYFIPFAEQIVWLLTHTPKPQHAVSTYALSDILASAILDAGLRIGLDLRIFKKLRHFDLLHITDAWVLAAFNKSWYQPGLEARYQNDCDPIAGNWVTNWQPDPINPNDPPLVTRYNPFAATSGSLGNAGTEADLLQWCDGELPNNVADPDAPDVDDLIDSVSDLLAWGEQIGLDVWSLNSLCVVQTLAAGSTSTPLIAWLTNLDANPSTLPCQYTYNSQVYAFPCDQLANQLLLIWGCLDVSANPWGPALANAFPGTVTTFNGNPVFNLSLMLIDPAAEFTLDNLLPAIRNFTVGFSPVGVFWYAAVEQCFDQRYAAFQPGDLELVGYSIGPCCGNGLLDQQACGQGPGATPCEQCDDGNTAPGDGCSPLCRLADMIATPGCGDGLLQSGFGEECDDGNTLSGDGCESDCTLPLCPAAGLCTLPHANPGCADPACCGLVCDADPTCCDSYWHQGCADLATAICPPCIGQCVNRSYCDNPNCCIEPGNCVCYAPNHPISIALCGACDCCTGDVDLDADVDLQDFSQFAVCFTGACATAPCTPPLYTDPLCECVDFNLDGAIDLVDFSTFASHFGD